MRSHSILVFSLISVLSPFLALSNHAIAQMPPNEGAGHAADMAKGLDLFKKSVRPILAEKCLKCHGGKSTEAGLDLTDRAALLKGGESGPVVLVGKANESLLVKLLRHEKEPKMPKGTAKLPAEVIRQIALWIDLGAPYDKPLIEKADTVAWTRKRVPDEAKQHWAFQPLRRAAPPAVNDHAWCVTPIDLFIRARQELAGVAPSPPAERRRLLRRAYMDVIGLPPTPTEVECFIADDAPEAWAKVVDRLLSSPHYGERWARHWLDLVRFGESHGFEHDYDRPTAYHYRDFVIKALNEDMPYDQFIKWQIAGDEYAPESPLAWMATGYLAAGVHSTQITKNEVERHRYDELDDILATTGTAMLGLTIGCCRCHDHKYDPFPQADYYRMLATFTTTVRSERDLDVDPAGYQRAKAEFDRRHEPIAAAVKQFETGSLPTRRAALQKTWRDSAVRGSWLGVDALQPGRLKFAGLVEWIQTMDADWRRLKQRELDHLARAPKPALVKALVSSEGVPPLRLHTQGADFLLQTHFLRRGDCAQKDAVANPGFLQVLMSEPGAEKQWQRVPPAGSHTSYRRMAFAEWLTDVDRGAGSLLARVMVNRLWQHHLGRGIAATPSDFGNRGEPPTHPELLDWLASEFVRPTAQASVQPRGWSLKHVHKLILMSAVYRQDSRTDETRLKADRDNKLLWHQPVQRLEAEVVRDCLLAFSGMLDPRMFGPGTLDESSRRRSVYFTVKRSKLIPMMVVFDAPEALVGVADRPATTIAPQALLMMNNRHVRAWAKSFARRVSANEPSVEKSASAAYLIALSRPPTADELGDARSFIRAQVDAYRRAGEADASELALTDFCQVLMSLNEFIYID
jgi:hypothetical protein